MQTEILDRYIRCQTSEEEEALVVAWLEADPRHKQELHAMWFVYNATTAHAPLHRSESRRSRPAWYRRRWAKNLVRAAAAVLLIAGSWHLSRRAVIRQTAAQYLTVAAPLGQRVDLTLQDGTTVCLNSGAKIEYPVRFDRQRRVRLSGEALFDVEHDAARPFVVETFACDVEVLGTRFNVSADAADNAFSTALLRGRLLLTNKLADNERLIIHTNDFVRLDGNRLLLENIASSDDYLWPEGILNLAGHSFSELMSRLEEIYGVRIVVERSSLPELDLVRGKIRTSMGLDYVLRTLQEVAPFDYRKDDRTDTIYIR